uniref:G-protein coupled receptor 161 n=1 Tax=Phallusia mammillata TaxID=59560 RepID=A0A6F9DDA4_9ASCI|nr:G-protein coupled receptor 161 [Phallusia mammillata]
MALEDNTTFETQGYPITLAATIVQCILLSALMVFGLVFNSAIIWLVYKKRTLRTITNMWVVSLCASQLLTSVFSIPFIVMATVVGDWLLGDEFCQVYGFFTFIFRTVSILSVAGIAMDRYHVISRPFSKRMKKGTAKKLIFLSWWSAAVSCVFPLTGLGRYRYSNNGHICGISWMLGGSAAVYSVFYITSVYITTGLAAFSSYALIYKVTKSQAEKHRKTVKRSHSNMAQHATSGALPNGESRRQINTVNGNAVNPQKRNFMSYFSSRYNLFTISSGQTHATMDSRATQTIIFVLTVFVVCWAPYFGHALYLAFGFHGLRRPTTMTSQWIEFTVTWLSMSTCVWDPLLYGACTQNFKAHFINLFMCRKQTPFDRSRAYLTHAATSNQSGTRNLSHANGVSQLQNATQPWHKKLKSSLKRKSHQENEEWRLSLHGAESIQTVTSEAGEASSNGVAALRRRSRSDDQRQRSLTSAQNASFVMDDDSDDDVITSIHNVQVHIEENPQEPLSTISTFMTPQTSHYDVTNNGAMTLPDRSRRNKRECLDCINVHRMYGIEGISHHNVAVSVVSTLPRPPNPDLSPPVVRRTLLPLSPQRSADPVLSDELRENSLSWQIARSREKLYEKPRSKPFHRSETDL